MKGLVITKLFALGRALNFEGFFYGEKTMRKKLYLAMFLFGLMTTLLFGYTRSWTESTPTDSTVANQIDDFMRGLRVDVAERLEDYIGGFNASDSNEGFYHVLFLEQTSFSLPAANKYVIGGKLIGGKCELVGKDEDGDEIQLSYTGKHMIGSGTTPQAYLYNDANEDTDGGRESTIRWKGDQSGGETTTLGYIEISHDGTSDDEKGRFRVMLNDGNDTDAPSKCPIEYAADGTIDVTNSVSVLDEDAMSSDSATKVATQQSIKAYVEGTSTAGFTPTSYAGEESITLPNGLVLKFGNTAVAATGGTISFPVAFDNDCLCVVACSGADSDTNTSMGVSTHDYLAASFDYSCANTAAASPLRWFAIGY